MAKKENNSEIKPEVGQEVTAENTLTVGTVGVTFMSDPGKSTPIPEGNSVKFTVGYTKDFKGKKYWNDGDVIVISQESAEQFKKLGIGK